MVVAAIMAALLTMTVPAVVGMLRSSQGAQADNILRATLMGARYHAIQNKVVSGIRCQQDGHIVQIYAVNTDQTYSQEGYLTEPTYVMQSVKAAAPEKMPGPWRVTVRDVGRCDSAQTATGYASGDMLRTWIGPGNTGHKPDMHWLGRTDVDYSPLYSSPHGEVTEQGAWFTYPVVLFTPLGRVVLGKCIFPGSDRAAGQDPWYPTLDGAFGQLTDILFTDQVSVVGWRSTYFEGRSGSQDIPVRTPTTSAELRIFNYVEYQGAPLVGTESGRRYSPAITGLISTGRDCRLDVNTGMVTRRFRYSEIDNN